MKSLRVMIVDDSALSAKKIAAILEESGHIVAASCHSGAEAINAYLSVMPDVVTMDIAMPDMNGVETVKELTKLDKNVVVVMATALGQEQMVIEAIEAGAKGYLLKPISADALREAIESAYQKYGVR